MKIVSLLFSFISFTLFSYSQNFGNEWIKNYSQSYFKIKIPQDGIYRINYSTLTKAGINPALIQPQTFQIFAKGVEQSIYVNGEKDGSFDANDYIEFFAQKNDGWFDQGLFASPDYQGNPYYSMFNDTAVYFLTWNDVITNKRLTIETDANFAAYTPSQYCWKEQVKEFHDKYFYGAPYNIDIASTQPNYTNGEGWYHSRLDPSASATVNFFTPFAYASGPDFNIEFNLIGESIDYTYDNTIPNHHVEVTFASYDYHAKYIGYGVNKYDFTEKTSQLASNAINFNFKTIGDLTSGNDWNTLGYVKIKYPQQFNFAGNTTYRFQLDDNSLQSKSYLHISGFNPSNTNSSAILYDITNNKRIDLRYNVDKTYDVLIPNSGTLKDCIAVSESDIMLVNQLIPVNGDGKFIDFSSITSNFIIITHRSLWAPALAYKNYRSLLNALLVDVDEAYAQFGYGIGKDPLAIRNLARYTISKWGTPPANLFLIGKAYDAPSYRQVDSLYKKTLVPSFGYPPSDVMFTSGIMNNLYDPAIATGRLAAKTPDQVSDYLQKVSLYEQQQPASWMKYVLHFGGGGVASEQNIISNYLNNYADTIRAANFGGKVRSFFKTSSSPIQITYSDSIRNLINNGVSLMTFFGHGSGSVGFDQDIDLPSAYNNYGKYPFMIANACLTGNLYASATSSSEQWVLIPNKGVIGYLGTISLGIPPFLDLYTKRFYKNLDTLSYGKSVGKIIQNTIKSIQVNPYYQTEFVKDIAYCTTLHGDPAVVLNSFTKPDYFIDNNGYALNPSTITTVLDTFLLKVISTNIGKAISNKFFFVQVVRTFPDGSQETYTKNVPATLIQDTIVFKIPVNTVKGIGLNKFHISLDATNVIDEISETNNTLDISFLIKSSDVFPIYPSEFAIVPNKGFSLKASTSDPFAPARNYVFEYDTTDAFNSPFKKHFVVNSVGGVLKQPILLPFSDNDSTVIYWRVSLDSIYGKKYIWRNSSFQYIKGKTGWEQAHTFQFANDNFQFAKYNRSKRLLEFVNDIITIKTQTGGTDHFTPDAWLNSWRDIFYYVNGERHEFSCINPYASPTLGYGGINVVPFDRYSGQPWINLADKSYGAERCNGADEIPFFGFYNLYLNTTFAKFIDTIPDSTNVLIYNIQDPRLTTDTLGSYKPAALALFKIGVSKSQNLGMTFIIYGKKGAKPGKAKVTYSTDLSALITQQDTNVTNWKNGKVVSPIIGPSRKWGSLHWRAHSIDKIKTNDKYSLSVLGIQKNGSIDTVIYHLPPAKDSMDILNLSSRIDAVKYPTIKLVMQMIDDSTRTPVQIDRWQVIYDGIPETAISPKVAYQFYKDSLQEGDKVKLIIATENVSDYDMDSLLISSWIIDANKTFHSIAYSKKRKHPAGDILIDTISYSTTGIKGLNNLWLEVNPINKKTGYYDQLEQYHFNNIISLPFTVYGDKYNPILDVTFDGIHIMNNDIVSAKPAVLITLKDENKYLMLNDTSLFKVYLKTPASDVLTRVYFTQQGKEILKWTPGISGKNVFKIEYNPNLLTDGTYLLEIQAKDVSNNISGDLDYKISFDIVNKPTISNVLNYPNPFSTSTRFVFTLTGSEVPQDMKIQIMTISGKVVREIMMNELGNLHIGRNISDYAWDGKDEFGDKLANGVYIYKVFSRLNGTQMDHYDNDADKYFVKGFGKMVIIR